LGIVKEIMADQRVPLSFDEQERIQSDLLDEVFGLGPLEPLLRDPKISDILVNDKDHVFIEKGGLLQRVNTTFRDDRHLLQIIDRIVSRVGRRVDESSPMVDARLPDGSRVNAIIPPLALDGPSMSIRRFGTGPLAANQLVKLNSISAEMMEVLSAAVKARHQHPDLGRHGRRQNHVSEHSVAVHSQQRAAGDDRGRGRTAAGAGEHCAPGNAAAQY
jgi:pilus assembly protein CpaF